MNIDKMYEDIQQKIKQSPITNKQNENKQNENKQTDTDIHHGDRPPVSGFVHETRADRSHQGNRTQRNRIRHSP